VHGTADATVPVVPDVAHFRDLISNVYFVGQAHAGDREWVLVDTGDPGTMHRVARAAAARFGPGSRPAAIILTHGHFDHAGTARQLADAWDAPVFAHELELPYITGRSLYPPADPTAGGGMLAALSFLLPRRSFDLGARVRALPADGTVPFLPGWRWIHTPGHSPGHVSLFREADRTLLVGDAFITERVESLAGVVTQRPELRGPPRYLTTDWWQARHSVEHLAALRPAAAGTGHGLPVRGDALTRGLNYLLRTFDQSAVPRGGRYVGRPARADVSGTTSYPPPATLLQARPILVGAAAALAAAAVGGALRETARRSGARQRPGSG
jgi:glyoxylase-like metal-dependent hydrolase (beta-lactamase superfamily II)